MLDNTNEATVVEGILVTLLDTGLSRSNMFKGIRNIFDAGSADHSDFLEEDVQKIYKHLDKLIKIMGRSE